MTEYADVTGSTYLTPVAAILVSMFPVTTKDAARALGIKPDRLRRWTRDEKFDFSKHEPPIPPPENDPNSPFQPQRLYTREWIEAVADVIGKVPDFRHLEDNGDR